MTPTGALDGIRVIEVGTLISGPFAGRLLGDLGAEVIKIEPPGAPDPLRTWGQAELDGHHFFWTVHARNKKAVNAEPAGGQGPRTVPRAGQEVRHPRREAHARAHWRSGTSATTFYGNTIWGISSVRVSGYGQDGPEAHKAGYASVAEATSGLRHMNGFPGGPPPRLALSLGDSLAGMFAVQGALAALYRRTVTGEGQIVDVALDRILFSHPGIHHSRLRRRRRGPWPVGHPAGRHCAVEHLPQRRRQLGGDRGEPGHRVPPPVRRDGPSRVEHRRPLRQSRSARAQPGRTGQDHRRLGGGQAEPDEIIAELGRRPG